MKKLLVMGVGIGLLALFGCMPIETQPPTVHFTATVVPPLTVVCDASQIQADLYRWDFGDGTHLNTHASVVSHTYAQEGRYVVILTIDSGQATGAPGAPGPGNGGSGNSSVSGSAYQIVDLLQTDLPEPVIVVFDSYGNPVPDGATVRSWSWLTFWAGASTGKGDLWYQWEIVRVNDQDEPIPYDWETEPHFLRSNEMEWKERLPGPRCGSAQPWIYRIRLIVTDDQGRRDEDVIHIKVG